MIKNYIKFVESLNINTPKKITMEDVLNLNENFEYYISDDADIEVQVSKEEFVEYGSDKLNIDIQDNRVIGKVAPK